MYIFLSPHFDDAIGSAGGVIRRLALRGEDVRVMTIMSGVPWRRPKKMIHAFWRRFENWRACHAIGAHVKNAGFLDVTCRMKRRPRNLAEKNKMLFNSKFDEYDLVYSIADYISKNTTQSDVIIAPAGLGNHIDHRVVRAAAEKTGRNIYLYEEFYYDTVDNNPKLTADYKVIYLNYNEIARKIEAMKKYKKTLRELFGRGADTMENMSDYFTSFRVHNGRVYEKFSDMGFLK